MDGRRRRLLQPWTGEFSRFEDGETVEVGNAQQERNGGMAQMNLYAWKEL